MVGYVRSEVLEALEHQEYPFALMVKELVLSRDSSRTPVFQAVFNFIRSEESGTLSQFFVADERAGRLEFGGLVLEPYPIAQQEGQFELVLEMTESAGSLRGRFKCDARVFEPETVRCLAEGFATVLEAISRRPDVTVAELAARIAADPAPSPASEREEIDL
jgi:non-ribosomal peptide synthetase component F